MFNSREEIEIIKEYWLLDLSNKKDVPAGVLDKIIFNSLKSTGNLDKSIENPDKNTGNPQSKEKESKIKNKVAGAPLIPVEIQTEINDYLDMREKMKKPMTDKAIKMALEKLEELAPGDFDLQRKILNQSVFNSWQGLFKYKDGDEAARIVGNNTGYQPSTGFRAELT